MKQSSPLGVVDQAANARIALVAPRPAILAAAAKEPISATGVAARLGLPRQRVNYHVRTLARAGFLRRAGRRRRRGLHEQLWVANAHAYLLAPELLGGTSAHASAPADAGTAAAAEQAGHGASAPAGAARAAAALLLLGARMQSELGRAWSMAEAEGKQVPVLALDAEVRFAGAAQRAAFAAELSAAVARAIAAHSLPAVPQAGRPKGRGYRLLLGCYPTPRTNEDPR